MEQKHSMPTLINHLSCTGPTQTGTSISTHEHPKTIDALILTATGPLYIMRKFAKIFVCTFVKNRSIIMKIHPGCMWFPRQ